MKRLIFGLISATWFLSIAAYSQNISDQKVYQASEVDSLPIFAHGKMLPDDFFRIYLNYPDDAYAKKIQGTVRLKLVLDTDGVVTTIALIDSVYPSLDSEAIRVSKLLPLFKPAIKNGLPVFVEITLPVIFAIDGIQENQNTSSVITNRTGKNPLYILDGEIVEDDLKIEAENIESVRVIKGEKAIAKYGERAKDGVIEFTTKQFTTR